MKVETSAGVAECCEMSADWVAPRGHGGCLPSEQEEVGLLESCVVWSKDVAMA